MPMDIASITVIASALADATRVRVLDLADGMHAVGDIATALNVTSSDVSYHLRLLERGRLVEVTRRGRRHFPRRLDEGWRVLARAFESSAPIRSPYASAQPYDGTQRVRRRGDRPDEVAPR